MIIIGIKSCYGPSAKSVRLRGGISSNSFIGQYCRHASWLEGCVKLDGTATVDLFRMSEDGASDVGCLFMYGIRLPIDISFR